MFQNNIEFGFNHVQKTGLNISQTYPINKMINGQNSAYCKVNKKVLWKMVIDESIFQRGYIFLFNKEWNKCTNIPLIKLL